MIGKAIKTLLSDSTLLTNMVGNNIFPLVMSLETPKPSVVYVVESIVPQYTKDGWAGDGCTFRATAYADSYSKAIEVAFAIRTALELVSGTYESINIERIECTGREEFYQFDADVYIIRLNFTTKINSYG
jgi:hypothetical protein